MSRIVTVFRDGNFRFGYSKVGGTTATTEIYTLSLHGALPIYFPRGAFSASLFGKTPVRVLVRHKNVLRALLIAGVAVALQQAAIPSQKSRGIRWFHRFPFQNVPNCHCFSRWEFQIWIFESRRNYGDHRDLHSFPTRRSSDLFPAWSVFGVTFRKDPCSRSCSSQERAACVIDSWRCSGVATSGNPIAKISWH